MRFIPAVKAFTRKWKPDIIHTVPPVASEAALRAGKTTRIPVVASVLSHVEAQWKTLEPHPLRSSLFHWLERRALQRSFARIICITEHSRKVLVSEGLPPERVVYVPHAVDTEKFNPSVQPKFRRQLHLSKRDFVLGYAGTLTKDKGLEQLIHGLALLKHHQTLHLILAGVGEDRLYFEGLVRKLGLTSVTFLGRISHDAMPAFMKSLDLYVVPSYTETLPTTVLEALSTGTPALASAVGGVADFLHSQLGILIQEPNAMVIAEMIEEWLERRTELRQMGNRGRQYVEENHSWNKTCIQTEDVYRQCIE
jgi:glycosyltransferase involved in cell wall biosynthesis